MDERRRDSRNRDSGAFCTIWCSYFCCPYYTSVTNQAHDAKVKAMYSMINASIIVASVDSMSVGHDKRVPDPSQLTLKNTAAWFDSKNWSDNKSGKWTYLPTGATIVYNKISQDDYSLVLNL